MVFTIIQERLYQIAINRIIHRAPPFIKNIIALYVVRCCRSNEQFNQMYGGDQPLGRSAEYKEMNTIFYRVPVVHELKCHLIYFTDVLSGKKNFEVRKNDRDYQVGDMLFLRERSMMEGGWDYTGRTCSRVISYILDDPEYVKEGFIIMGLE